MAHRLVRVKRRESGGFHSHILPKIPRISSPIVPAMNATNVVDLGTGNTNAVPRTVTVTRKIPPSDNSAVIFCDASETGGAAVSESDSGSVANVVNWGPGDRGSSSTFRSDRGGGVALGLEIPDSASEEIKDSAKGLKEFLLESKADSTSKIYQRIAGKFQNWCNAGPEGPQKPHLTVFQEKGCSDTEDGLRTSPKKDTFLETSPRSSKSPQGSSEL